MILQCLNFTTYQSMPAADCITVLAEKGPVHPSKARIFPWVS
jgi:hypothetical protein